MMGQFLEAEKRRQAALKKIAPYFSDRARADGIYKGKGKPHPFCLAHERAEENLFAGIRAEALAYFREQGIKWHAGKDEKPSNHLCGSQVCCVNFLFPFAHRPDALAEFLRCVFPSIGKVLPMEDAGQFVSFEWIGLENYLGERIRRGGKRTRGANFTSADAAVMFEHDSGLRQIALIEWKYTESYGGTSLRVSRSGTDRTRIYAPLYERDDCPLRKSLLGDFGDLFYEPFYQLMRQQMLAHEMERAQELGAQVVSVLHIAPAHNPDFVKVTSPGLRSLGGTVIDVWKRLVRESDRFRSVSTEQLFGGFLVDQFPELRAWWNYLVERYCWLTD